MALPDNAPKLIAEMLNTDIEYGLARPSPTSTRKSDEAMRVGASEWPIHSCPAIFTSSSVPNGRLSTSPLARW